MSNARRDACHENHRLLPNIGMCGVLPACPYAIGDNFTLTFIFTASSKNN
jgi:hypothetical protein